MSEKAGIEVERKSFPNEREGLIFDIQRFSIHDGPGIRTLVFMKGCPLSCLWCCNPESRSLSPEVMLTPSKCIGCGRCVETCPTGAAGKKRTLDAYQLCIVCGRCVETCPSTARQMAGRSMRVDELVDEVERDIMFYRYSGGGITVTGGEPLMQVDFVVALLMCCQERGIHTAVETCGFARWEEFAKVIPYLDLVLYDIKHMDTQRHRELTGMGNELILENANNLAETGKKMIIRVPVIPGYNDALESMEAIARFVVSLKGIEEVHLLPYHRLGESKYERMGKDYPLRGVHSLDKESLSDQKRIIESHHLNVQVGG